MKGIDGRKKEDKAIGREKEIVGEEAAEKEGREVGVRGTATSHLALSRIRNRIGLVPSFLPCYFSSLLAVSLPE